MINDETKENLYKRELIGELINELRNAVLTGDTIYLLDKFVASLNMHEQQKQRADELENHVKNLEMDSYLSRERADIYKNKSQRLDNNWNELKEKTIETYSTLKKEKSILAQYIGSILCVMDELEGKENVFETVQSLEDNND